MTTNLLDGLRVLDLSLWQPGHYATQLLADLGADVLKVEPPGGDRMRPLVDRFVNFNGRKRSMVVDLKTDADLAALRTLVADAEVVVENHRPGVADRLGVAPMAPVNPRRDPGAAGGAHSAPGMGVFATRDGRWVMLGVFSEDHFWDELCSALGLGLYVGLPMALRAARAEELRTKIASFVATLTMAETVDLLGARSVPVAPILTREEMLEHPHLRERRVLTTGPDGYLTLGHPIHYAVHPALPPGAPPQLADYRPVPPRPVTT